MLVVQAAEQVELGPLVFAGHIGRPLEIEDRVAFRAEERALIRRRQKAGAPVERPALHALRVAQHDVARQVLVFAPQAIGDPRPGRREARAGNARVDLIQGRHVVGRFGIAAT